MALPILRRQPVFLRPSHRGKDHAWPFKHAAASDWVLTSRQVATGLEPVRVVRRFLDGTWQFVCGTTANRDDMVLTTLGWVMDRDPSVGKLAWLQPGSAKRRRSPKASWTAFDPRTVASSSE